MSGSKGAEPILEVRNLKTHLVYPTPSLSPLGPPAKQGAETPKHQGGERRAASLNCRTNRRLLIETCKQKRKELNVR